LILYNLFHLTIDLIGIYKHHHHSITTDGTSRDEKEKQ